MITNRIKEHRARLNLKQEELAKLVGVRRETIGNLEKGKYNPSLVLAWNIAQGRGAQDLPLLHLIRPEEKVLKVHGEGKEAQEIPLRGEHPHKTQQRQKADQPVPSFPHHVENLLSYVVYFALYV